MINELTLLVYLLIITYLVLSFLIGSIPFGYLIGRFAYRTDLRKHGSGNIGAMNALRTLGTKGAVAVLLLDAVKGAIPVLMALHPYDFRVGSLFIVGHPQDLAAFGGIAAVLGHCFSPWLNWKGGKGVATAFGAVFAICWPAGLTMVAAWILGALILTKYSSVGSMAAAIVSPFALYAFTRSIETTVLGIFLAFFIPWTHRENIARLRAGTESPISLFRRSA